MTGASASLRLCVATGALCLVFLSCASPGTPPGGPVDTQAPQIVRVAPDSGRTGVTPKEVIFSFDEVVSERPSGAPSIGALFLISPRDGDPRVDWNRDEIAVRPNRGWKANTAYTITLLPGLSDLRGNVRNTGAVTIFATGSTIPAGQITGTLFNWPEGRVIQRGLVQARPVTDTTIVYVTSTDSVGSFTVASLPPARYTVRGFSDDNSNRALDLREAWDTVGIQLADSAKTELLAFVHDSIGSRLLTVNLRDSVTIELLFDNPLSVATPLAVANVRVHAPDSTDIPIISVALPLPDTVVAAMRRPSRPPPSRSVIVKLGRPLRPRTDYRVIVTDARNLIDLARASERTLTVPAAPAPATTPTAPPAAAPPPAAGPVKR